MKSSTTSNRFKDLDSYFGGSTGLGGSSSK